MHTPTFARYAGEIESALAANTEVRRRAIEHLERCPLAAKAVSGPARSAIFRQLMRPLLDGQTTVARVAAQVESRLPRGGSPYGSDNRVFCKRWGERLVRSTLSRLYVVAVLRTLAAAGEIRCFVPHSPSEERGARCAIELAGRAYDVRLLLDNILQAEETDDWRVRPVVPDHPWCSHVVTPVDGR